MSDVERKAERMVHLAWHVLLLGFVRVELPTVGGIIHDEY